MIYCMYDATSGLYKFGMAHTRKAARKDRMRYARKQIAELLGIKPKITLVAWAPWHYKEEHNIHRYLHAAWRLGEWFEDSPETQHVIQLLKDDRYIAWQKLFYRLDPPPPDFSSIRPIIPKTTV